ncbi:MAG: hypothetical protein NVSMB21_12170 [Vulcanimicrobiaceae bacterium]
MNRRATVASRPHRSRRRTTIVALAVVAVGVLLAIAWQFVGAAGPPLPFKTVADVPLTGDTSRLDYESFDPRTGRLFIAHLGAGSVIAVDTKTDRLVGTIENTPSVRGVLAVPELGRVYAAAAGSGEIVVIDERTLGVVARIAGAGDVDGLAYDPKTKHVFVSDESGGRDTVLDTRTNRIVARVDLGGEAGNTQYDPASGHIFVAVQTQDRLDEIDPRTNAVIGRYDLPGCLHAHGVAIDVGGRAAYVACEINATVVKVDLNGAHRVTAKSSVGIGVDVLALDATAHRLYVASESGIVSVFDVRDGRFARVAQAYFAPNAHVVGVDGAHRLYFPLRDIDGRPVLRIVVPS